MSDAAEWWRVEAKPGAGQWIYFQFVKAEQKHAIAAARAVLGICILAPSRRLDKLKHPPPADLKLCVERGGIKGFFSVSAG